MAHEALDWSYAIQLVRITPGSTSQADGSYTPPSEATVPIRGHVSDLSLRELQRLPEGVYSPGDRRLVTDAFYGVKAGDEVQITEADSTVTRWRVQEEERTYALLERYAGLGRRSFLLKRKI
jgi:hypothetical protein